MDQPQRNLKNELVVALAVLLMLTVGVVFAVVLTFQSFRATQEATPGTAEALTAQSALQTAAPSVTPSRTTSPTAVPTTAAPSPTATATLTPAATTSPTVATRASATPTETEKAEQVVASPTESPTETATRTPVPPTATSTATATHTAPPTASPTQTSTPTTIPPTATETPVATFTPTPRPTRVTATAVLALATPITPSPVPQTPSPTACVPPDGWVPYTVRSGDNLFRIALRAGVPLAELQEANCIPDASRIEVGQVIYVPRPIASSGGPPPVGTLPVGTGEPPGTEPAIPLRSGCQLPYVTISAPQPGSVLFNTFAVQGTATLPNIDDFSFFKVEVRGAHEVTFHNVNQVSAPAPGPNSTLATINPGLFGPGVYQIRLTVVDVTGNYPEPCTIRVNFR